MANTYTDVIPKILAQSLTYLRANSLLPRLVNRDFDGAAAQRGDTVNVPIPPSITTVAVTAAATPPATTDITMSTTPVVIGSHYEAPFYLTDTDRGKIMEGAESMAVRSAVASLSDYIDASIATAMDVGGSIATGTAGSPPFTTLSLALDPLQHLDTNKVMRADRRVIMSPVANMNLLTLAGFTSGDYVGDLSTMLQGGFLGNQRAGASWWMTQNTPTHTAGTGASYLVNGALSAGATTIVVDTGTGTVLVGDVVAFAGDTNKYVVATALSGGSFTIGAPGLRGAVADNAAVTVSATHVSNFAFSREAVVFASRPFLPSAASVAMDQVTDDVTGLTLRAEITREHKRDRWLLDAQWGAKVVRSQGVIKIMG